MSIGGGIAGVASKSEDSGIKIYNERSKYKEWEFLYDPRKDGTSPMSAMGRGGTIQNPATAGKPGDTSTTQTGSQTNKAK
jgi:hypothetical protein